MPEISADKVIGKTLIAKKRIPVYSGCSNTNKPYRYVEPGNIVGVVSSYIINSCGGVLHWSFGKFDKNDPYNKLKKIYYVKHEKGAFEITDEIKTAAQLEKEEEEKKLIAEKGAFRYYLDKYGLVVLLVIAGTILAKAAIQKK